MDAQAARGLLKKMDRDEDYWQRITDTIEEEYVPSWGWANMVMSRTTGANLVAFSTGWGDGGYPSFWGYDAGNEVACLVSDFGLLTAAAG
jgi:hypothetical protein